MRNRERDAVEPNVDVCKAGVSPSTVGRIWREHGLKPHLTRTFKLSKDKRFAEKLEDVVGLYLNPPENAIVLSCDEKSQMQALDRTQPGLAYEERALRNDDSRLQTQRHNHTVRRAQHARWIGPGNLHAQAPASGMDPVLEPDQAQYACR